MTITFTSLTEAHFPLLLKWLETSHVKDWWDQDTDYNLELVKEKFGKRVHEIPISNALNKLVYAYIILSDSRPIGYIQTYNAHAFAKENEFDMSTLPASIAGCDIFIGEKKFLGRELGVDIIEIFWKKIVSPHFKACLIDPDTANSRAINIYKKAGFKPLKSLSGRKSLLMLKEK